MRQKLCAKSLDSLALLINSSGCYLNSIFHKILKDKLLILSFGVTSKLSQSQGDIYEDSHCRTKLFECLKSLNNNSSSICASPLNYTLEIFAKAMEMDPSGNNSEMLFGTMATLLKDVRPKKEIFYFPTDIKDFRDTVKFNQRLEKKFECQEKLVVCEANGNHKQTEDDENSETILIEDIETISDSSGSVEDVTFIEPTEKREMIVEQETKFEVTKQQTHLDEKIEEKDSEAVPFKKQKLEEDSNNEDELFNQLAADFVP